MGLCVLYGGGLTGTQSREPLTASADVAVPGSEVVILELDNLSIASNHNGGAIHFGPDGKLYIAVGENADSANAQTLADLLGKMLRINSDGSVPMDNPFYSVAVGVNRATWSLGLRNPFTFAFQPGTGRMLINDVGQYTWEEINEGVAGANYGWPNCEGACNPSQPNLFDPISGLLTLRGLCDYRRCLLQSRSQPVPSRIRRGLFFR